MSFAPTPQRITSLVSLGITVAGVCLLFITAYLLGDEHGLYDFLFGGGKTHLMSQTCTSLLFFWGVGEVTRQLIQLKREQLAIKSVKGTHTHENLSSNTPLTQIFSAEVKRGVHASQDYLEARDLVTATRDGILDQLASQERGVQAAMWLIPLSGFLGTVLGMSATIARFDELFNPAHGGKLLGLAELAPAIQGLSTAFDTTLLALALVIPLKLLLVYTQNTGEYLAQELEQKIAKPLLQHIAQGEHLHPPQDSNTLDITRIEANITRLRGQSNELNSMIGETAQVLGTLRDQLTQHPTWSTRAQEELRIGVEHAIREGIAQASLHTHQSEYQKGLENAVHQLAENQHVIYQQLNIMQTSLEAPLIIKRGTELTTSQPTPPSEPPHPPSHKHSSQRPLRRQS